MHICSDKSLQRPGMDYRPLPGGGYVGFASGERPKVNWKHIDGPLLYMTDGGIHWLTYGERIQLWLGMTTIEKIDQRRRY